jgi:hypothetical protein
MANAYTTTILVNEDGVGYFDLRPYLASVGVPVTGTVAIRSISYTDPVTGQLVTTGPLVAKLDGDTLVINTAALPANWNGSFSGATVTFVTGQGNIDVKFQVIVAPVNDAPSGTDETVYLFDSEPYAVSLADLGYADPVEGHAILSIIITDVPPVGTLLINGQPVTVGMEILASDIDAGALTYDPPNGTAGNVAVGFTVRDAGGTTSTATINGVDTDPTPNYLTIHFPEGNGSEDLPGSIGDTVWVDADADGEQDRKSVV